MTPQYCKFRRKLTLQSVIAFVLVCFGMLVTLAALYMPPQGEIHPSVITVFGMTLVAGGAFMGIDLNFQFKHLLEQTREDARKNETENETV